MIVKLQPQNDMKRVSQLLATHPQADLRAVDDRKLTAAYRSKWGEE